MINKIGLSIDEPKQPVEGVRVISLYEKDYSTLWKAISEEINLERFCLIEQTQKAESELPTFGKMTHLWAIIKAMFCRRNLVSHLRVDAPVVLVGHAVLPFLLHNFWKLKRLDDCKVYVFSLFFHNPVLMWLYGRLVGTLSTRCVKFIVFSKADIPLFKKYFHLLDSQIVYVPYGTGPVNHVKVSEGDYCFAGGYSNRDYGLVVEAFRRLEESLVICASKHNDLPSHLLDNVKVFYDLPLQDFVKLVAGAKLCIMPLYARSGASGQSVTLKYMQFGKPIIATRVPATADYLDEQNAVFIEPGDSEGLVKAIGNLLVNKELMDQLGKKAQQNYFEKFQSFHFEKRLLNVLLSQG